MKTVKYHAKACFDVETELQLSDDAACDSFEVWLNIIADLEQRYRLEIEYKIQEAQQ